MKKAKKILALLLVIVLTFTTAVGMTVAYFMDKDAQVNTFTTGDVAIDLYEDFGDNDATGIEELLPVTYNSDGTRREENVIEKEVYVMNTGSEDAYVRVHIAIPQILDNGDPSFDASSNVLHFNYDKDSIGEGKWDWSKTTGSEYEGDWNYYETSINGVAYNVYVVTYEDILSTDESTVDAMSQVYLDKKVSNEDITKIKETLGAEWKIYVAAEGTQAKGFNDAYEALNESFGTPGAEGYVAPAFLADAENRTWMDIA